VLTGSEDELSGPLPALFQSASYHLSSVGPSAFPALFTESLQGVQLLLPPRVSGALSATLSLCCVLVFSSLFIVKFFFNGGGSQPA
jgi:hypothetical protein